MDIPIGMVVSVRKLDHGRFRATADCYGTTATVEERTHQTAYTTAIRVWWQIIERTDEQFKPIRLKRVT